jgi:hypothetical protein
MKITLFVILVCFSHLAYGEDDILGVLDKKAAALPTATPKPPPPIVAPPSSSFPTANQQADDRETQEIVAEVERLKQVNADILRRQQADQPAGLTHVRAQEQSNSKNPYLRIVDDYDGWKKDFDASWKKDFEAKKKELAIERNALKNKYGDTIKKMLKTAKIQSTGEKVLEIGNILEGNFELIPTWPENIVDGIVFSGYEATPQGRPFRKYIVAGTVQANKFRKPFTKALFVSKWKCYAIIHPLN